MDLFLCGSVKDCYSHHNTERTFIRLMTVLKNATITSATQYFNIN